MAFQLKRKERKKGKGEEGKYLEGYLRILGTLGGTACSKLAIPQPRLGSVLFHCVSPSSQTAPRPNNRLAAWLMPRSSSLHGQACWAVPTGLVGRQARRIESEGASPHPRPCGWEIVLFLWTRTTRLAAPPSCHSPTAYLPIPLPRSCGGHERRANAKGGRMRKMIININLSR